MEKDRNPLVDPNYAGTDDASGEYLKILNEAKEKGKCPFCPENLTKTNEIDLDMRKLGWLAIRNKWPYENAEVHLILIPERHLTAIEEIKDTDWAAIQELISLAKEKYPTLGKYGGGLAVRFGTNSGVTIRHLHFHLIAPVTDPETGKVSSGKWVNFPFG